MNKILYKGEMICQLAISDLPECEVSLTQLRRNLEANMPIENAIKRTCPLVISKVKSKNARKPRGKRVKKQVIVQISKPKPVILKREKSELPAYSKEEALAIMAPAVNPKKCHLHSYKIYK